MLECQILAEGACWRPTTLEEKSGGRRVIHALSRASHAPTHGGCRRRNNQHLKGHGLLVGAGVPSRGRSGDSASDGGVASRS